MQQWEYTTFVSHVDSQVPSTLWNKKDKTNKTDLDHVKEMGAEGWELVSSTPYTVNGFITDILFMFKRPK